MQIRLFIGFLFSILLVHKFGNEPIERGRRYANSANCAHHPQFADVHRFSSAYVENGA